MMSNNTTSRHGVGPVRQHSLQHSPRHPHQIRRQRSTEDKKNRHLYFANPSSSSKCENHRRNPVPDRPNVRVAWSEQSVKPKSDREVEIVAQQIQAKKSSRPATGNKGTMGKYFLGEKATILYSRQELAERLRLAWKQREENKSNIDIFLAHSTIEDRCDSGMSTETNLTIQSTPKKNEKLNEIQTYNPKIRKNNAYDVKKETLENRKFEKMNRREFRTWFPSNISKLTTINIVENLLADDNVIKIDENKKSNKTIEETMLEAVTEKKSLISINCHNWHTSLMINNKNEVIRETGIKSSTPNSVKKPDYSQAKLKRANYQRGSNKAFVNPIIEKRFTPRVSSRNNTCQEQAHFRRTSSAPPQHRTQVNIVIDASNSSPSTTNVDPERWIMSENNQSQSVVKSSIKTNRPIKSAPTVKRRSKANKKRSLAVTYSKDGEDETEIENSSGRVRHVKAGKNMLEPKSTDVVTMVSLISSADSESDMDEISSRDDKLICELRNKLPTTSIIKSSNGLFGGIRKPFKSVSFQQDSYDHEVSAAQAEDAPDELRLALRTRFFAPTKENARGLDVDTGGASRDIAPASMTGFWKTGTCEAMPIQLEDKLGKFEATLTDREKRCLAVPIGDVHDKKRKLLRCRSTVAASRPNDTEKQLSEIKQTCFQEEMPMSQMTSRVSLDLLESNPLKIITNPLMLTIKADIEKNKRLSTESYCQTPKEKECWHLYRRMCDKGVFISFDTVLRGMLTPTEYRLRQKEMSRNC